MIAVLVFAVGLVGFFWWLLGRRRAKKLAASPLAGFDTGVRSPYRVPGRAFRPKRGF